MCALLALTACQAEVIPAEPVDYAPLARLTSEQYVNTVADLFPAATLPELDFPAPLAAAGGFENNATFNSATGPLVDAQNRAALRISAVLEPGVLELDCAFETSSCAHEAIAALAERAWRRPLSSAERDQLLRDYDSWASAYDPTQALQLTVQLLLQSPYFLYFPRFGVAAPQGAEAERRELRAWELATRMSYFLWNTMPDAQLRAAARADELRTPEQLGAQAQRMLVDGRARAAVVSLHRQLFDLDEHAALDVAYYEDQIDGHNSDYYYIEYLPQVRYEPEVFVMQQVFEGEGTLAGLLTSTTAWVTPDTARIAYGIEIPAGAPSLRYATPQAIAYEEPARTYYEVELDGQERAGLFTLASFLSAKANPRQPSPVRRGVMLIERLQCRELQLPGDVPPLADIDEAEPTTNRERYALHTSVPTCQGCHQQIDGLGFSFEHYDSLGAWRELDNGYPVDASGEIVGTDVDGPVADAVELMGRLAESRTIHDCYVRQLYRYAQGRNESDAPESADAVALASLQDSFWASGGDIQALLVDIVTSEAFRTQERQP